MTENNSEKKSETTTDDPIVERKIGKKFLQMRASHKLPLYYSKFSLYDRALPRICKKINEIDGYLKVVDVGANIGDTVSLIADDAPGSFLCIEGDSEYLPLLKINTSNLKDSKAVIEECYCSKNENIDTFKIERFNGTAKLKAKDSGRFCPILKFKSLDAIIEQHPEFKNTNLLKIDTDGFEINVLNGGTDFLKSALPIIYFEFVPELYRDNQQDPMFIFQLLSGCGYHQALIYDNFGLPLEIVSTGDEKRINELSSIIDNNKIYYYDILTWHDSKQSKYKEIFDNEIMIGKNEM